MPYTINPQDSTQPLDTDPSGSGAAELRALKAYLATLTGLSQPGFNFWQGFRNKLVNGGKSVDYIGSRNTITLAASDYVMDGAYLEMTQASKLSSACSSGTLSALQRSGSYQTYTVAAAVAAPAAGDYFNHCKLIEGIDCEDLHWGTAYAKSAVFSLCIKFSIAGTYSVSFTNSARNRSYVTTVTQLVAGAQEYKYIVVPGDVAGVWSTAEGATGIVIRVNLGAGATFTTATLSAWQAGDYMKAAGATNFCASAGATLDITDEQFEVGTVPTPFEVKDVSHVTLRCQRYWEKSYSENVPAGTTTVVGNLIGAANGAGNIGINLSWKATKCKIPTVTLYSPATGATAKMYDTGAAADVAAVTTYAAASPGIFSAAVVNTAAATFNAYATVHFKAVALLTY